MKGCGFCREVKPIADFAVDKRNKDGHKNRCRACQRLVDVERYGKLRLAELERNAAWRRRNKKRRGVYHRNRYKSKKAAWRASALARYGLSTEDYDALLAAQGGTCALCEATTADSRNHRLHVDHDHATGRVRGLLCGPHNRAIGQFSDDPDALRRAADYLERT